MTFQEEKEKILAILDEIYETFVISCVMAGVVTCRDFWEKKDDYLAHDWIQSPKKWIDPQKESGAMKTALNIGVKTYKQIAAENGTDWRTQIDDIAEVSEYAKSKGLEDFTSVLFDGKMSDRDEPEEQEETDEQANTEEEVADSSEDDDKRPKPDEDDGEE